jgi:mercuric reductase
MKISDAIARLNSQLPLLARQAALSEQYRLLHRKILRVLVDEGRAMTRDELASKLAGGDVDAFLARVGSDDLVVLDSNGRNIVGAYPVTIENTPYAVTIYGNRIHAMCALDAVSVAPMFDADTEIESTCRVSGEPVAISMSGADVVRVSPGRDVQVGVRWQMPDGAAAHSMCMEMVFLKDLPTALAWQGGDEANASLFGLEDAIVFGSGFFRPLLA